MATCEGLAANEAVRQLERYFRDLHAGTQHITSSPAIKQACGRELAGLADGKRWVYLDLVDGP